MTAEEAWQLQPGDAVTRKGENGTVESAVLSADLKVSVRWTTGFLVPVAYSDLERVI